MAVQRDKVCLQLAESMLDAAGSLQQLQEELDRISLRSGGSGRTDSTPSVRRIRSRQKRHSSRKATKNEKKKMTPGADSKSITVGRSTQRDESFSHDTVSLGDSESCEQPSSLTSSSHFDSAIGSLHSQTDNDSMSSQLFIPPAPQQQGYTHHPQPPQTIGSKYHTTPADPDSYSPSQHNTTVVEHYTSPQVAMPTLITVDCVQNNKQNPPQYLASRTIDENQLQEDKVMVMGTHVQLRQKAKRQTVQQWQLTTEDSKSHFQWLESSNRPSTVSASIGAYIEPAAHTTPEHDTGAGGVCELESEGSGSTVVADEVIEPVVVVDEAWQTQQQNQIQYQHPTIETPQASFPIQGHSQTSSRVNMPPRYHTTSSIGAAMEVGERDRRQPPKRNASILQRLRRRRGSFRQRRHIPVQRSLSDRFVYHLKKKWENNSQEDFYPISNPSLLRPIGRLLKTYAGRLHIIQLHKPADGRYGVYISQGVDQKIFISRFATAQSEKFYAGLLCPGDEIVSVNKHKIRGRSLDSVYRMLSQLDSVIIAVVPVTAHRNW